MAAAFMMLAVCLSGIAVAADGPVKDTSRIVSIGGDVTEILYALKADPKIIAVDTTSTYPASALKNKQSIGYMRALSAEGVLSTNPTVIIAATDAGPEDVVSVLKSSSVPYVEVPDDPTPNSVIAKIRLIASVIGADAKADALAREVEHEFEALAAQRAKITKPQRGLFVLTVQNGRAVVAGRGTAADSVFALSGLENAASGMSGFKPLTDEAAVDMAPDVIVTMTSGAPGHDPAKILELPAFKTTPAAKNGRLVKMDGNYLLNFGPRAAHAARELMQSTYPDLAHLPAGSGQ